MAIFISYSHDDADFVDVLAKNLVMAKHNVWMDRWELNVGDSLTTKIEEKITSSGAILVILSKKSVESAWCKRELTAGLVRELEERKTLVLPCVIDDCQIPLFLRDKLYADFRKNPDEAFSLVDRSLQRISNATMGRTETPDFHTDFSVDWQSPDNQETEESWSIRWTFVDHSEEIEYVVLSELKIYIVKGETAYKQFLKSGDGLSFARRATKYVVDKFLENPETGLIEDNFTKIIAWNTSVSDDEEYLAIYSYRRMGIDNGFNILLHIENNLKMAIRHHEITMKQPANNK